MHSTMLEQVHEAVQFLSDKLNEKPDIGLILGSGLGVLADEIEAAKVVPYADIPHFPVSTVEGHAGELVIGKLQGKNVILMKGRFHLYEGYGSEQVTFPILVMKQVGVRTLLVTNAAGGIRTSMQAGDLMLIADHINWMSRNPLIGANDERLGPRFPDMSEAYHLRLRTVAKQTAEDLGIPLLEGVYLGLLGPSYETPAEIRMLRILGADAVGMSTVPEVIAANHAGINVLGISCITNLAAGILNKPLSHKEVIETTERVKERFVRLVKGILPRI